MRFVKMTSIVMSDQLRTVCLNSLTSYVKFMQGYE